MTSKDTVLTFGLISCTPSWVFAPPNERSRRAPEGFTGTQATGPSDNSSSCLIRNLTSFYDIFLWHPIWDQMYVSDVLLEIRCLVRCPISDQMSSWDVRFGSKVKKMRGNHDWNIWVMITLFIQAPFLSLSSTLGFFFLSHTNSSGKCVQSPATTSWLGPGSALN